MGFFYNLFEALKDAFNFPINPELSEFQRKKLMHEFHLFYGKHSLRISKFQCVSIILNSMFVYVH